MLSPGLPQPLGLLRPSDLLRPLGLLRLLDLLSSLDLLRPSDLLRSLGLLQPVDLLRLPVLPRPFGHRSARSLTLVSSPAPSLGPVLSLGTFPVLLSREIPRPQHPSPRISPKRRTGAHVRDCPRVPAR